FESITSTSPSQNVVVMAVPDVSKVFTGTVLESALAVFDPW
ncbi:hypothetical protein DBR06_SOUSAS14910022, partial [Sousa chinensis]